jgi:hypothetical protein
MFVPAIENLSGNPAVGFAAMNPVRMVEPKQRSLTPQLVEAKRRSRLGLQEPSIN